MQTYQLNDIFITSVDLIQMSIFLKEKILKNCNPCQIITFNLDNYRISKTEPDYLRTCKQAALVLPDGMGFILLIKLKYGTKLERITGNDLLKILLEICNVNSFSVAFVGSTPNILTKLKNKIQLNYPNLKVSNILSPSFNFEYNYKENDKVLSELKESKPDVLFLALGCPRQELWIAKYKDIIGAKINIGVGSAFDFYTREKLRAPIIVQKIYLEWFWRLMTEPRRLFKRYIIQDVPFFFKEATNILFKNEKISRSA